MKNVSILHKLTESLLWIVLCFHKVYTKFSSFNDLVTRKIYRYTTKSITGWRFNKDFPKIHYVNLFCFFNNRIYGRYAHCYRSLEMKQVLPKCSHFLIYRICIIYFITISKRTHANFYLALYRILAIIVYLLFLCFIPRKCYKNMAGVYWNTRKQCFQITMIWRWL